ncbi:L-aminopeptidase/D-esterase [Enhydrobacter aerosaccus]|uniref:L-aminopeptidase/D-esterase n=1 Tax=Enhydrobacter aerosaccus TaxID=225324 RepID=A0A1T4PGJ7_9HYPH|nr:P1 family peptidase [Enhydrobacter aerosaccus]SJZ90680.1 L-aminopeptidase/D-esterase [Enhydrobacter aerosaccus]
MFKPGSRNLITDVDGLLVGNAEDDRLRSGVTVVLCDPSAVASVDVRGGGPGTRETDLLDPSCLVDRIDALCLSGGSAFGLSACDGVMRWLRERGRGMAIADTVVPIVPGAILFDLLNGGDKGWDWPPYRDLAYAATGKAGHDFALGNAGAGMGAKAGNLKGGLGSASAVDPRTGLQVGALVAVNARGYTTMGGLPQFWAWALEQQGEFGGLPPPPHTLELAVSHRREDVVPDSAAAARHDPRGNTTIAVVATNARLDKGAAHRIAMMAQDGLARSIRPVHTPHDGDTVFAIATGRHDIGVDPLMLGEVGTLAADCLARAVARGVYHAASLGAVRSWKDVFAGRI